MKSWMLLLAGLATLGPPEASAAQPVRRLALVVGANVAEGRPTLRYAVADAARFANVLKDLGGVQLKDVREIPQPTPTGLEEAVRALGDSVRLARNDWIKPRVGIEMRVRSRELRRQSGRDEIPYWYDRTFTTGVLAGARFELNGSSKVSAPRPFLHAAIGPFFRPSSSAPIDPRATPEQRSQKGLGASLGGGIDIRFGSHLGLGVRSSYDLLPRFKDAAGRKLQYGGWKTTLTTSWFFGGGRRRD